MGQALSDNFDVGSIENYLLCGPYLDDEDNCNEEDFVKAPVHFVSFLPLEFEVYQEVVYGDNEEEYKDIVNEQSCLQENMITVFDDFAQFERLTQAKKSHF